MKSYVVVLCLSLFLCLSATGCATERAISAAVTMAQGIGVAIVEKSHITDTTLLARAGATNPHYRVWAVVVNGVYLDIGLDGVNFEGSAQASGSGADIPLTPETIAMLREAGLDEDLVGKLLLRITEGLTPSLPEAPR